jgi:hypothetical protein
MTLTDRRTQFKLAMDMVIPSVERMKPVITVQTYRRFIATWKLQPPRSALRQYSKAPEHAYDANLRRVVPDQARASSSSDTHCGLSCPERLAKSHAAMGDAKRALD